MYTRQQIRGRERQRAHANKKTEADLDIFLDVRLCGVVGFRWSENIDIPDVAMNSPEWQAEKQRYFMFIEGLVAKEMNDQSGLVEEVLEEMEVRNFDIDKIVTSGGVSEDIYTTLDNEVVLNYSRERMDSQNEFARDKECGQREVREWVRMQQTVKRENSRFLYPCDFGRQHYAYTGVEDGQQTVTSTVVYCHGKEVTGGYRGRRNEKVQERIRNYNRTSLIKKKLHEYPLVQAILEEHEPELARYFNTKKLHIDALALEPVNKNYQRKKDIYPKLVNWYDSFKILSPQTGLRYLANPDSMVCKPRLWRDLLQRLSRKSLKIIFGLMLHWHSGRELSESPSELLFVDAELDVEHASIGGVKIPYY